VFELRRYAIIEKPPFLPLCIDRIGEDCYSLSQNKVIDGSMVADPDVEIRIDHLKRSVNLYLFRTDRSEKWGIRSPEQ
jgi:hypothetical protein